MQCVAIPEITPDQALLRVEACGMCGSDAEQYRGAFVRGGYHQYPVIPGHEFVGRIERIGDEAASRWKFGVGDRVAVEAYVGCGVCRNCQLGRAAFCPKMRCYGLTSMSEGSGLWGGYAQYVVLQPNTVLLPLPEGRGNRRATKARCSGLWIASAKVASRSSSFQILGVASAESGRSCRESGAA